MRWSIKSKKGELFNISGKMKNEKWKMLADREGISHFIVEGDAQWVIDETKKKKKRQGKLIVH